MANYKARAFVNSLEEASLLETDGAARAEAKLVWIMPSRDRGRRSQICGKCHVLKGRNEEQLYADYIDGKRSYMEITLEIRSNR